MDGADYRSVMAAAAGPGGAEMGHGATGGTTAKTESLTIEGTWTPTFGVQGLDVSYYQAGVNWQEQWNMGARFAYIKATEGNYYSSPSFASQYQGARNAGMIRGAYHFANPMASSGADQARIFVQGGGRWSGSRLRDEPICGTDYQRLLSGQHLLRHVGRPVSRLGARFRQYDAVADGPDAGHLYQHFLVETVRR